MNSKKRLFLLMIGATVTSLMGGTVSTYAADNTETTEPLTIAEQGIFSAGGITMQIMQMFYTRFRKKKPVCQWYSCMDMDSHVCAG